jgi:Zn-dependent protease with chaperone function
MLPIHARSQLLALLVLAGMLVALAALCDRAAAQMSEASTIEPAFGAELSARIAAVRDEGVAQEFLSDELTTLIESRLPQEEQGNALGRVALALGGLEEGFDEDARGGLFREIAELAEASLSRGDQVPGALALALAGLAGHDDRRLARGIDALERTAPNGVDVAYFRMMDAAQRGAWSDASDELELAHQRGLPDADYTRFRAQIDDATPATTRYWKPVLGTLAGWLAGFALLFALGALLSQLTLASATRLAGHKDGAARGMGGGVRSAYRALLVITGIYFYASIPLVAVFVIGVAAAIIYGFFAIGHVPLKLVALVGIVALVTVWAVLKAFWAIVAPRPELDPGRLVDLAAQPRLSALLEEVAQTIGTRKVDRVFLTPATEFAVFERGSFWAKLRGKSERCMILGIGLLEGLNCLEVRSILAHEYGHYRNEDTAGGSFALSVRQSFFTLARALVEGGAAGWHNPAWWFVRGFEQLFLRVSQGASRLQEILADRWAIFAYGSAAFVRSEEKLIARAVRFDAHVKRTLLETVDARRPLGNLYRFQPQETVPEEEVERAVTQLLEREAHPFDSHPSSRQRIAWAEAIGAPGVPHADDDEPSWSLFADRAAIEDLVNEDVRANLLRHGVNVDGEPAS